MPKVSNGKSEKRGSQSIVEQPARIDADHRKVVYDKYSVELKAGKNPLTVDDAKYLLGWQEEEVGQKFGSYYVKEVQWVLNRKIRCTKNVGNRPLDYVNLRKLIDTILEGHWRFNGEARIIGRTEIVLNGQHTFMALVCAAELWKKDPERWPFWTKEPTIDTAMALGVLEDDEIINTMDTAKSRSLWEVIYRSPYFAMMPDKERKLAARMTESAIRVLWHRTGAFLDSFVGNVSAPDTHAKSLDFLAKHQKLLECVKHILIESAGKSSVLVHYITPGVASGLMYLMATSATPEDQVEEYRHHRDSGESLLDLKLWDKASDFWVKLAKGDPAFGAIKNYMARRKVVVNGKTEPGLWSSPERQSILVNAWAAYAEDDPIKESSLKLKYVTTEDGLPVLARPYPSCGGIDFGSPEIAEEEEDRIYNRGLTMETYANEEEDLSELNPTEEEIEAGTKTAREKRKKKEKKILKALKPGRKGKTWAQGDVAWIGEPNGEPYLATILEDPEELSDGSDTTVLVEAADENQWEVRGSHLSLTKPETRAPLDPPKAKANTKSASTKPKTGKGKDLPKASKALQSGMVRWVCEDGSEPWRGRVVEVQGNNCRLKIETGFKGAGNIKPVKIADLRTEQPKAVRA
jgi:hypothetical protein